MRIDINYVARVEGEGSVTFDTGEDLQLRIWEPPRFFEGFLVGRRFDEVPDIVARICGICPVSHMSTSIYAIENALGVTSPPNVELMRDIMVLSQIAASHIVHLYSLVLPDYRGKAITGAGDPEVKSLIRMKEALNAVTAFLGGRPLHPINMLIGGFAKAPSRDGAMRLVPELEAIRGDAMKTLSMVSGFSYPPLESDAEYLALYRDAAYAMKGENIRTVSGVDIALKDYDSFFSEEEAGYSNAKRTRLRGDDVLVGALARLQVKYKSLHPMAMKAAEGMNISSSNPYYNINAQAVEIIHCIERCIELLHLYEPGDFYVPPRPKSGVGRAMTEAPRGLLYHEYEIDSRGTVRKANIVTPTAYNCGSMEKNLKTLVKNNAGLPREELVLMCEKLVRAYDPCFSCSVH